MTLKSLQRLRKRVGLSRKDVSQYLGTTPQLVANIERGITPIPARHMQIISELYMVSLRTLININLNYQESKIRRQIAESRQPIETTDNA